MFVACRGQYSNSRLARARVYFQCCSRTGCMIRRPYKIVERADELLIGVRFLRPVLATLMLSTLALFWCVILYLRGESLPLLTVLCLTGVCAFFIAFYTSWVSIKPGLITTWSGPIPLERRTRDSYEIEEIFCQVVRASTGKGVSERYALMANARSSGFKPVTILYGFVLQNDATEAGRLLTRRLNDQRPAGIKPVVFRQT